MVAANLHTSETQKFQVLETDQKLALLWFIYQEMGESITPAAPGASTAAEPIANGLYKQLQALSQEEQLQMQRDLIEQKNSLISREYGAMSDTTKLLFWYLLAQGMDEAVIVPFPEDYTLNSEAESLFHTIVGLDFQSQITLFREIVGPMGVDPNTAMKNANLSL